MVKKSKKQHKGPRDDTQRRQSKNVTEQHMYDYLAFSKFRWPYLSGESTKSTIATDLNHSSIAHLKILLIWKIFWRETNLI